MSPAWHLSHIRVENLPTSVFISLGRRGAGARCIGAGAGVHDWREVPKVSNDPGASNASRQLCQADAASQGTQGRHIIPRTQVERTGTPRGYEDSVSARCPNFPGRRCRVFDLGTGEKRLCRARTASVG